MVFLCISCLGVPGVPSVCGLIPSVLENAWPIFLQTLILLHFYFLFFRSPVTCMPDLFHHISYVSSLFYVVKKKKLLLHSLQSEVFCFFSMLIIFIHSSIWMFSTWKSVSSLILSQSVSKLLLNSSTDFLKTID